MREIVAYTHRVCDRYINFDDKGLKLGLPSEEEELFEKLGKRRIITKSIKNKLKLMRGFRNILVHRYAEVDDELVFENLKNIGDFKEFRKMISGFLAKNTIS